MLHWFKFSWRKPAHTHRHPTLISVPTLRYVLSAIAEVLSGSNNPRVLWRQTLLYFFISSTSHSATCGSSRCSVYFCWLDEWVSEWKNEWSNLLQPCWSDSKPRFCKAAYRAPALDSERVSAPRLLIAGTVSLQACSMSVFSSTETEIIWSPLGLLWGFNEIISARSMLAITNITCYSLVAPNLGTFIHPALSQWLLFCNSVSKRKFKRDIGGLYSFKIIHYIKRH